MGLPPPHVNVQILVMTHRLSLLSILLIFMQDLLHGIRTCDMISQRANSERRIPFDSPSYLYSYPITRVERLTAVYSISDSGGRLLISIERKSEWGSSPTSSPAPRRAGCGARTASERRATTPRGRGGGAPCWDPVSAQRHLALLLTWHMKETRGNVSVPGETNRGRQVSALTR